jgi:protein-tyrosine phosphatase
LKRLLCIALACSLAWLVAGCATTRVTREPATITRPVVERLGPRRVRIRWPASFTHGHVRVYAGETPDTIDRTHPIARATSTSVDLTDGRNHPGVIDTDRLYYELVPDAGEPVMVSERRLPLEGTDNFRDLGGYRTRDGRTVKWGRVYRSGELSGLTPKDRAYLKHIGLRVVTDLRSEHERELEPSPPLDQHTIDLPIHQKGIEPDEIQEMIQTGGITTLYSNDLMLAAYRSFVADYASRWALLLQQLQDPGSVPLMFHCTAGKDRTGFGAAVFLLALGVPEETIYQDYLATNWYRRDFTQLVLRFAPVYSLFRTKPEAVYPLLAARREYLEAAFDLMKERYGSIDAYLEEALGLTPERRAALQAAFLTGTPVVPPDSPEAPVAVGDAAEREGPP